ncbi:hypothetical protein A1D23_02925 [Chelonobacter oris]|uniref:GNAT family N-acetyltransferase n=1 Tax=Chelonobacter oris TaxID=505317 RepID=UPI0024493E92|nr:GNAT family protein [Chelonobacter oris]MDH3001546.1 hypothetical protein [Chelonobacter oris]
MRYNKFDQPIGKEIDGYTVGSLPEQDRFDGKLCVLERLDYDKHHERIYDCYLNHMTVQDWTYLPNQPLTEKQQVRTIIRQFIDADDLYCFTIIDKSNQRVLGTFCLMRADPLNRSIEIGWVIYSNLLKRSKIATEAQFLMMRYVFETLQYRRYEWKCDALNTPSYKAAARLGFTYEGTFRNAVVYKNRNRDTAWFSIISEEWPLIKSGFEHYLSESNFDMQGNQLKPLRFFSTKNRSAINR